MCVGGDVERLILENDEAIKDCEEYRIPWIKIVNNRRSERDIEDSINKGRITIGTRFCGLEISKIGNI